MKRLRSQPLLQSASDQIVTRELREGKCTSWCAVEGASNVMRQDHALPIEHSFIVAASLTDPSRLGSVDVHGTAWECAFEPDERDDWIQGDWLRWDWLLERCSGV